MKLAVKQTTASHSYPPEAFSGSLLETPRLIHSKENLSLIQLKTYGFKF